MLAAGIHRVIFHKLVSHGIHAGCRETALGNACVVHLGIDECQARLSAPGTPQAVAFRIVLDGAAVEYITLVGCISIRCCNDA